MKLKTKLKNKLKQKEKNEMMNKNHTQISMQCFHDGNIFWQWKVKLSVLNSFQQ